MLVLVSLLDLKDTERVQVAFHFVHPDILDLVKALPCGAAAADTVRRATLHRVRPLLHAIDVLGCVQRQYEASRRRELAAMGAPRALRACFAPLLLHDACTLTMGCLGVMFGGDGSWFALSEPCSCGANEWGLSCTPPALGRGYRVVRHALDECVSFCWSCARRRPVGDVAALARSWRVTTCA